MQREEVSFSLCYFYFLSNISMKKSILFFFCLLLFASHSYARNWNEIGSATPSAPHVVLTSNSDTLIVVNFQLNGFFTHSVKTPKGLQTIVSVPKMVSMLEAGSPDLPQYAIPAIIGDFADMEVRIVDAQYTDYENIEIAPSKGNLSRQVNPDDVPYTYGEIYGQNALYPSVNASLETPYILRDFRGQNIMVRPFSYNPVTKTLRVYHNMTIAMNKVSDNGENVKSNRRSNRIVMDSETKDMYARRFVNFEACSSRFDFLEDEGAILVVCPEQFMAAMQPFVEWKNMSGRPCTMVSVSDAGGNHDTQIKNFIKNIYNNPESNLTFILLVGDYEHLTPHAYDYGCSDIWFGMLEGDDCYPEALVGRFSVETVKDVETQVNKVLYYERDMPANVTWINKGMGIAVDDGAGIGHNGGESDLVHIDYIRDTLLHYTYSNVSQQYSGGGFNSNATLISNDFNDGVSICNFCNHGNEVAWSVGYFCTTNINALTNDYKWPFIWSTACLNGKFNYPEEPCFAEAWMRATNDGTGAPTGAIGGMFSWMSQSWDPPMTGQDYMVDVLTEWESDSYKHTLGGASLNGSRRVLDLHPGSEGTETHNTWILFGDPSLMVRTDNPTQINAHHPDKLVAGMTEMRVLADVKHGYATLSLNGQVLSSAAIENGIANLHFTPLSSTGTAKLCVISYNKVTLTEDIQLVSNSGSYISLLDFTPITMNYGQPIAINLFLKNFGTTPSGNLSVNLSSTSEYIDLNQHSAFTASIGSNETLTVEGFTLVVASHVPDGENVLFTATISNGTESWEHSFLIRLEAPIIELVDVTVDGSLEPGENGTIHFKISNNGSANTQQAVFEVFSSSSDISLPQNTFSVTQISAGEEYVFDIPFTIASTAQHGSSYSITYGLNAGYYGLQGEYSLAVGDTTENFETGDFGKFDWQFTGKLWIIADTDAHSGRHYAKSGSIGNSETTSMAVTLKALAEGHISFWYKTSTESFDDMLYFYIDNEEKGSWHGDNAWSQVSFYVPAGTHTFKWSYTKDFAVSAGEDCVGVDDIKFPPFFLLPSLEPVTNLEISAANNKVTLTWEAPTVADIYEIRRDGEIIATQSHTSFAEDLPDGIYTYSVVAKTNNGNCSSPAYATVCVGALGIVEDKSLSSCVAVFPNPSNGTFHIDLQGRTGTIEYAIFNHLGQTVMHQTIGTTNEIRQIDMRYLSKGLYFLRLTDGRRVVSQKIIIE